MYDIIFRNGTVVDGSGRPAFKADVAIQGEYIAAVGNIPEESRKEFDITGLVLTPGFIDMHSHSDMAALAEPELLPKLMQGITSELLAQDGIGPAPLPADEAIISSWRAYLAGLDGNPDITWDWRTLDDYLTRMEQQPMGCNQLPLLPSGNVRMVSIGLEDRPSTPQEMEAMDSVVDEAMQAGAWGVSLGMVYMPCTFFSREEMVRIYSRVAQHGGFLVVHMRNGSSLLLESIDELFSISKEAHIPLHISHFKAAGRKNWYKMSQALKMLEDWKQEGNDISFDIYPYTAGSTMFSILLPPWAVEGGMRATLERLRQPELRNAIIKAWTNPEPPTMKGKGWDNPVYLNGWENIIISSTRSGNPEIVGRRMTDIAKDRNITPEELAFVLMEEEQGDMGVMYFSMDESRVAEGICHPYGMICTDGLLGGTPHPRVYGSFPRVLGHFVRDLGSLTLEDAVHKMTGKSADRLGLKDRGFIAPGQCADIVVFSAENICDNATYDNPRQYPSGIEHVLVNGIHSVMNGIFTGALGGKVLRCKKAKD